MDNFVKLEWDNKNNDTSNDIKRCYIDKPIFNAESLYNNIRFFNFDLYIPILNHIINRYNNLAKLLDIFTIEKISFELPEPNQFDDPTIRIIAVDYINPDNKKDSINILCNNVFLVDTINSKTKMNSSALISFIFDKLLFLDDINDNKNKVKLINALSYKIYNKIALKNVNPFNMKSDILSLTDNKCNALDNSIKYGYLFVKSIRNIEDSVIPTYDSGILNINNNIDNNSELERFAYCKLSKFERFKMLLFMYMYRYNIDYEDAVFKYNSISRSKFENADDAPFYHSLSLFDTENIKIEMHPIKVSNYHDFDKERDYRLEALFIISDDDKPLDKIYISANTDYQSPKLTDIAFDFTVQYMSKVCGIRNIDMELERQFVNQVCSRVVYVDKNIQKEMSYKITEEEKKGDEDNNE